MASRAKMATPGDQTRHDGLGRQRRTIVVTICLALMVAACGGDAVSPTGDPSAETNEPSITTVQAEPSSASTAATISSATALPAPNPASAEIALDDAAAASVVIGLDGGAIEATGSDGLHYRLEIPAGFLADEVAITMTPITDLASLVLDVFSAGVQFEPDGLALPGVAWLEITGADVADDLVGFTYEGDGREMAIGWADVTGDSIRLPISHFSGGGAGVPAPDAENRPPNNPYRAMGGALTAAHLANDSECIDDSHPLGSILEAWYQAMFDTMVEPELEKATENDLVLVSAIGSAMTWNAAREHYAMQLCDDLVEALENVPGVERSEQLVTIGLVNGIDTAADSCATTHDIGEVQYILKWQGLAQMLFADSEAEWTGLASERIQGCLTFELEFQSYIEFSHPDLEFTAEMKATFQPVIPEAQAQVMGWVDNESDTVTFAPLTYTPQLELSWDEGCEVNLTRVETRPASILLPFVNLPEPTRQVPTSLNPADEAPGEPGTATVEPDKPFLIIFPLEGSEFFETACTDLLGGPNPDGAWGPWTFNELHADELSPTWEGFKIPLEPGTGKLYGRATFERNINVEVSIFEQTTFDLFHDAPRVP